ncbi:FAD binding domain-containing protein [Amycolatopsis orientalis]|uniref:FAD binding domain-containing protein n=1 Tax=Amycolatopsis orientalis TaxID=31958 RepID=UPI0003A0EBDD|nr:xanthine dehydrogenase family protein subunit M [Amycolatopsis orientalis]
MKPPPLSYRAPETVDDALDLLAEHGEDMAVLAGGQSLVPLVNMRFARPSVLLDINRIAELNRIVIGDDVVSLGATVRLAAVEHDARLGEALPVLGEAARHVAHPQIRNRTTIGGTLCHADPAAEFPTLAVGLGARLHLASRARGTRVVAAEDFFESVFMTSKEPDELLVAADFPRLPGHRIGYSEISRRHGDFPFAGLFLAVRTENGIVTAARASAAGVADRPVRLPGCEAALTGNPLSSPAIEQAAEAASAEIDPPSDNHGSAAFRRGLIRTLVRRQAGRLQEVAA